ncbi:hypothetical protein [Aminobacterium mobile]|jgi:uncharacterized protein YwgA|uniref:hypothetical protein n=1 Tax=Aminobacterium mobile TaxID=81467 RepID=UPI00046411F7|nr:hypothetical protein [Aminobacterium mobile]
MGKLLLKFVIHYFNENGMEAQKILVQKAIYFLNTQDIDTGYCFAGYKYGPFSSAIMEDADTLEMFDEIDIQNSSYRKGERFRDDDFDSLKDIQSIKKQLDIFRERLLEGDHSFPNVELIGTVLYVMKNKTPCTLENTIRGVEMWKPEKYSREEIEEVFNKIQALSACDF